MATARPLLSLKLQPRPEPRTGGGKSRRSIKIERLAAQTSMLNRDVEQLAFGVRRRPMFAGRVHLVATMFEDSLATTHTPNDLFEGATGFQLVAALRHGYLIEAEAQALNALSLRIRLQQSVRVQADISRVRSISFFDPSVTTDQNSAGLWGQALERKEGRPFFAWLMPAKTAPARAAILAKLRSLRDENVIYLPPARINPETDRAIALDRADRFAVAQNEFSRSGAALLPVYTPTENALARLMASGTVVRVDPIRAVKVAAAQPVKTPSPPVELTEEPIVAVVDGGRTEPAYASAEAWRFSPNFVGDADAFAQHGNAVVSLVVHGHAWNGARRLPALNCRVGIVQAVPHPDTSLVRDELDLLDHIADAAAAQPATRVWNISANVPPLPGDHVSAFGHGLARLARAAGILPVVSVGNTTNGDRRLQPPADCEAALVVGGCTALPDGTAGSGCPDCARGPGPQLMQKPDLANFSTLHFSGGFGTGSSYATAVTSPLVAHTLARLKEQTPDLARAVVLHTTSARTHHPETGWGSPYNGHLPWECPPDTATFLFTADLKPGLAHYWNLPVPPTMLRDGKLAGGFKLTAILQPLLSDTGTANYFISRLETNLQFRNRQGKTLALLGKLDESETAEQEARSDYAKWQPVRHFPLTTIPKGRAQTGETIRIYARVYTRDRFHFEWSANEDAPLHKAAFVLSLVAPDHDPGFYDTTVARMANFVENALDVEVENVLEASPRGEGPN